MPKTKIIVGASHKLSVDAVWQVAFNGAAVRLDPKTRAMIQARRKQIVSYVNAQQEPAYGFNRGFGHNVDVAVPHEDLAELQRNLIRSHSSGVGEPADKALVRAAMLLRAHSLAQGFSAVRAEVIEQIISLLNAGITPNVPRYGSVGASGDLAPLSHCALTMMGEGLAYDGKSSRLEDASKILKRHKLSPIKLEMKEGLALNNGVQFSNAAGIIAVAQMRNLLKHAVVATAISNQVLLGSDGAYDKRLLGLRPHRGAQVVGAWLRALIAGSPLREAHRPYAVDGEIQDPYNLRCAPQILGACFDLVEEAATTFEIEANSVTDNPLILESSDNAGSFTRIASGGHFHGMPVAVKLYNLIQAMGIISRLSNMRSARYVDEARNKGLPSDLVWPGLSDVVRARSSGMMIPEYVSAALTNAIWGAAMPSHLFSLTTDAGQEDHVSMSATLAMRVLDTLPRLSEVLAIELAFASQAAAIRKILPTIPSKRKFQVKSRAASKLLKSLEATLQSEAGNLRFKPHVKIKFNFELSSKERNLSPVSERVISRVKKIFPTVVEDRELSAELKALANEVSSGSLLQDIPKKIWGV